MADQIVVIGNFDGVHRGHQAVLIDASAQAAARGLGCVVLTFSPHPALVLGRVAPLLLTTLDRKIELMRRTAPSITPVIETFDLAFAAQTPREFGERVLGERLSAKVVVVGHNFRFGHARAGDLEELTRLGQRIGFETKSFPLLGDAKGSWSSTRVRQAITDGVLDEAARLLGRPHMISGAVSVGDRRGRTLGFPTCNLTDVPEALPPNGVYAVLVDRVTDHGPSALAKGVANVGVRPTVAPDQRRPSVEVHLFDLDEDLYGVTLRIHLMQRLRDERTFGGLDALKAQIARDADAARLALANAAPDPGRGAFY
jgi:riboflavin kinase / FMN adenylyltransferase